MRLLVLSTSCQPMSESGSWNGLSTSIPRRTPIEVVFLDQPRPLTFGAQTGRGSDRICVIKRTHDHNFHPLITLVHELAQNAAGPMLPYLGFQILRLGVGQSLNQHRDYHNHPDYPNHTMKFGKYMGGLLQMLRNWQWCSYDTENQWLSFDALNVVHKVTPVTKGEKILCHSLHPWKTGSLDRTGLGQSSKSRLPNLSVRTFASKNVKAHHTFTCDESHIRVRAHSGNSSFWQSRPISISSPII